MKRNTNSITIMHSIQNQTIHQFSQKDKSVLLPYHQNQVKLFHMLQNEQTNYHMNNNTIKTKKERIKHTLPDHAFKFKIKNLWTCVSIATFSRPNSSISTTTTGILTTQIRVQYTSKINKHTSITWIPTRHKPH